jgi:3-deoxy-manno-octulosonate cytidylyltransferase (CMP-KDO synthetase)
LNFKVYIPARYGASRLPGKPLLELNGKPLIQHVYERACESGAEEVVIATDDERIRQAVERFGACACMTSVEHASGTDRIAEAARARNEPAELVIVNVQADEPQMPEAVIRQVASLAAGPQCDLATVCEPLTCDQLFDPNVVKVVRDAQARALYFSRAPIPWSRDEFVAGSRETSALDIYRRHVGIYGFRVGFLERFVRSAPARIEELECLEQLRALVFGATIMAPDAKAACGTGVDTLSDLDLLRRA